MVDYNTSPQAQEDLKKATTDLGYRHVMSKAAYMDIVLPSYESPMGYNGAKTMEKNYKMLGDLNNLVLHPDQGASDIIQMSGAKIGQEQAWQLVQAYIGSGARGISADTYYNILETVSPRKVNTLVAKARGHGTDTDLDQQRRLQQYQNRLFNFHADSSKFATGTLTINGTTGVEYGKRLIWTDVYRGKVWEAYVEGVNHDFSFDNGWTTSIGFTRALPFDKESYQDEVNSENENGIEVNVIPQNANIGTPVWGDYWKRFGMFWGHATPFTGGFFGEQTLSSIIDQTSKRNTAGTSTSKDTKDSGDDKGDWQAPVSGSSDFVDGQRFGDSRGSGVHDGTDWGSNNHDHDIVAAKAGKVEYVGYAAGWAHGMIVIHSGSYWYCYQEYSNNYEADTKVKVGDSVKKGQSVATMTNDHVHMGVTKVSKDKLIQGSYSTDGFEDPAKLIYGK